MYEALNSLESDELHYKVANSQLNEEAHAEAIRILQSRGLSVIDLPARPLEDAHAPTFGLESAQDRARSRDSFLNLALLVLLPLVILAVFSVGISFAEGQGKWVTAASSTASVTLNFFILWSAYRRLFRSDDKLARSTKFYFFAGATAIYLGMSVVLIAGVVMAR